MPGWLFMPKSGANTIWEAWEGNTTPNVGIASLDHYSKGAVCEWVFKDMCGINVTGENEFKIKPIIGGHFKYAYCEYKSIYGLVKCGWKIENGEAICKIEIPSNTSAHFVFRKFDEKLESGTYTFREHLDD